MSSDEESGTVGDCGGCVDGLLVCTPSTSGVGVGDGESVGVDFGVGVEVGVEVGFEVAARVERGVGAEVGTGVIMGAYVGCGVYPPWQCLWFQATPQ